MPKDVVYDLYINKNLNFLECRKILGGICKKTFSNVLSYYGIKKDNSKKYENRSTAVEKEAEIALENECKKAPYDELYEEYITKNKTMQECCEKFSISVEYMKKILKKYCIVKDKSLVTKTRVDGAKRGCMAKYGVDSAAKLQSVKDKKEATCMKRYGVSHPLQTQKCIESTAFGKTHPNNRFESILCGFGLVQEVDFKREYSIPGTRYIYDFLVGENILIEINPTASHNSTRTFRNYGREIKRTYHYDKSENAIRNGFQCIHVFDWDDCYKIAYLIMKKPQIDVSFCTCSLISDKEANDFLERYYIHGKMTKNNINVGLFRGDSLISVMAFSSAKHADLQEYELLCFCTVYDVINGLSTMYRFFEDTFNPLKVVAHCDMSKFTVEMYENLGFLETNTDIIRHWYNEKTHEHIVDNVQEMCSNDSDDTFYVNTMVSNGFVAIYDAGEKTYIKE